MLVKMEEIQHRSAPCWSSPGTTQTDSTRINTTIRTNRGHLAELASRALYLEQTSTIRVLHIGDHPVIQKGPEKNNAS